MWRPYVFGLACGLACTSNVEPIEPAMECDDATPPLELGACETDGGEPCSFAVDEVPRFREMVGNDDVLTVVLGPQGSSMFVIAARARDIVPGDLEDPLGSTSPLVELDVVDESGERMALLRRRSAFSPVEGDEGLFFNSGFFVVVDGRCPRDESVHVHGTLVDDDGNLRCGDLTFRVSCP